MAKRPSFWWKLRHRRAGQLACPIHGQVESYVTKQTNHQGKLVSDPGGQLDCGCHWHTLSLPHEVVYHFYDPDEGKWLI